MIKDILLIVLAALPYALGWIVGKVAVVVQWVWGAIKWGWQDARKQRVKKSSNP